MNTCDIDCECKSITNQVNLNSLQYNQVCCTEKYTNLIKDKFESLASSIITRPLSKEEIHIRNEIMTHNESIYSIDSFLNDGDNEIKKFNNALNMCKQKFMELFNEIPPSKRSDDYMLIIYINIIDQYQYQLDGCYKIKIGMKL